MLSLTAAEKFGAAGGSAKTKASRCAYAIIVMAILWLTEAILIAATALLPVFLLPMLNVMTASATCSSYITDSSMLFLGGLMLAAAVEEWNLHKRIALLTLKLIDGNQEGVTNLSYDMNSVEKGIANGNYVSTPNPVEDRPNDTTKRRAHTSKIAKGFTLCIAYASSIGGIATLTGTPPNLVLKDSVDKLYNANKEHPPISFANWMGFAVPLSLLVLFLAWILLQVMFLSCTCCRKVDASRKKAIREAIQDQYNTLGRVSFAEVIVAILFMLLVVLWLSREPPESNGWGALFVDNMNNKYVSDSTAAILIISLMFFLPAKRPNIFCWRNRSRPVYTPILTWKTVNKSVPWGIIVLLGGGFAIANASRVSKLSDWVGDQLHVFKDHDTWIMNLIFCCIIAMTTEVTSNTATANLLMPIMVELAKSTTLHPVYLMASAAIACSFAFMLPAATPPNAIVFSSGYLTIPNMVFAGLPMNILAILSMTLGINTWGKVMFDFDTIPSFITNSTSP